MLLDIVLLPLGIIIGVFTGGIPAVWDDLIGWIRIFRRNWQAAGWISEHGSDG